MSIRITLEIGHEAAIRTKRTPEGFTHDWEIFVRGINADIHHYVEKVVFNLHETFLKPRRVVKEPPYAVKESGYAGFNLPIDIYLKNSGEPKKITFNYDLHLQQSGPPIIKVQTERFLFSNTTEEFRHRLLKGGGTVVNPAASVIDTPREPSSGFEERGQLVGKPKLGGDVKKHKRLEEPKNSFADLFGPPITKAKISPDPKVRPKTSPKPIETKSDKSSIISKSKHSPHKDKDKSNRDRGHEKKNKDDKHIKSKSKERDHSKDKTSKREKSPKRKSQSPKRSPKRDESPKKISSPKRVTSPSSKIKIEEYVKHDDVKERNKTDVKSEKKSKKDKRDRDKDREREYKKEHKSHKESKQDGQDLKKSKVSSNKPSEEVSKEKEPIKIKEKLAKPVELMKEGEVKSEKIKSEKIDSEKHRNKHKKRDRERSKKDDKERKEDKKLEKKDKGGEIVESLKSAIKETTPKRTTESEKDSSPYVKANEYSNTTVERFPETKEKANKPVPMTVVQVSDDESSDASSVATDKARISRNDVNETKSIEPPKEVENVIVNGKDKKIDSIDKPEKIKKSKKHKDKSKNEKSSDKDSEKKRKRKSSGKNKDEVISERIIEEERPAKISKDDKVETEPASDIVGTDTHLTSSDYMSLLRDLQRKIMTLQDNNELQRVVQLIVATGRYEITNQTFDFDLCALDRGTVKRLQDFFAAT